MFAERPLMKCTHCGKLNWSCTMTDKSIHGWQVECQSCKARGPMAPSRDEAMELWNWRAPQESPAQETAVGPYCDCGHAVADHIDGGKCRFSADGSCMCSTANRSAG